MKHLNTLLCLSIFMLAPLFSSAADNGSDGNIGIPFPHPVTLAHFENVRIENNFLVARAHYVGCMPVDFHLEYQTYSPGPIPMPIPEPCDDPTFCPPMPIPMPPNPNPNPAINLTLMSSSHAGDCEMLITQPIKLDLRPFVNPDTNYFRIFDVTGHFLTEGYADPVGPIPHPITVVDFSNVQIEEGFIVGTATYSGCHQIGFNLVTNSDPQPPHFPTDPSEDDIIITQSCNNDSDSSNDSDDTVSNCPAPLRLTIVADSFAGQCKMMISHPIQLDVRPFLVNPLEFVLVYDEKGNFLTQGYVNNDPTPKPTYTQELLITGIIIDQSMELPPMLQLNLRITAIIGDNSCFASKLSSLELKKVDQTHYALVGKYIDDGQPCPMIYAPVYQTQDFSLDLSYWENPLEILHHKQWDKTFVYHFYPVPYPIEL